MKGGSLFPIPNASTLDGSGLIIASSCRKTLGQKKRQASVKSQLSNEVGDLAIRTSLKTENTRWLMPHNALVTEGPTPAPDFRQAL